MLQAKSAGAGVRMVQAGEKWIPLPAGGPLIDLPEGASELAALSSGDSFTLCSGAVTCDTCQFTCNLGLLWTLRGADLRGSNFLALLT